MYPDIFECATFYFRIQKFSCPHVSGFKSNLPVHTYPDIFDSANFSLLGPSLIFTVKNSARSCDVGGFKNFPSGKRI